MKHVKGEVSGMNTELLLRIEELEKRVAALEVLVQELQDNDPRRLLINNIHHPCQSIDKFKTPNFQYCGIR
jgi:hypothetical protein